MAAVYQQFLGQFTIDTNSKDFAVGATSVALTANTYFIDGYIGETIPNLCNHVETKIRAVSGQGNTNCWYNATSGKVTIKLNVASNIVFTDSALAAILGFSSATQASASTHTGDRKPRYTWRPSEPITSYPTTLPNLWEPQTTSVYIRSKDGACHSVAGTTIYSATISYAVLPSADVVKGSPCNYQSFEEFYCDVIAAGKPMRVYPDITYNNANSFHLAVFGVDKPGPFTDYCKRTRETYQGYWDVQFPLWKTTE